MKIKRIIKLSLNCVLIYCSVKLCSFIINNDLDDIKYTYTSFNTTKKIEKKMKIIVLGSGWSAMSLIQKLNENNCDITVISPRSFFFYTPLLAGISTGTVSRNNLIYISFDCYSFCYYSDCYSSILSTFYSTLLYTSLSIFLSIFYSTTIGMSYINNRTYTLVYFKIW